MLPSMLGFPAMLGVQPTLGGGHAQRNAADRGYLLVLLAVGQTLGWYMAPRVLEGRLGRPAGHRQPPWVGWNG